MANEAIMSETALCMYEQMLHFPENLLNYSDDICFTRGKIFNT